MTSDVAGRFADRPPGLGRADRAHYNGLHAGCPAIQSSYYRPLGRSKATLLLDTRRFRAILRRSCPPSGGRKGTAVNDANRNGRPVVCIFGSYAPRAGNADWETAYDLGRSLAAAGYVVANGGYDGIMEASAKGAKDAGGTTIGVTCSLFSPYRKKGRTANPYIDRQIHHDNVLERIAEMIRMSSGFVVLPGGTGTLSEFAMTWEYVSKGLIGPRPIFVLGDFWRPMVERMTADRPRSGKCIHLVATVGQIIELATRTVRPLKPA